MFLKTNLKINKEIIEKFTRAIYKAQQFVETHSAKEIAESIAPHFEDTPIELIETVVQRYKEQGSYATDPILDVDEWNNLQDIMREAGELPAEVDHGILVNTEIAESIISE